MKLDTFNSSELTAIFEIARIALADLNMFDRLAENMDIDDDELWNIREKLVTLMEKE